MRGRHRGYQVAVDDTQYFESYSELDGKWLMSFKPRKFYSDPSRCSVENTLKWNKGGNDMFLQVTIIIQEREEDGLD